MKNIVIIGSGLAGYMLAKEFRKCDAKTPITIVTQSDGCFYSKPLLSTALTQKKTPEQLPVNDADTMRHQLNATIHTALTVDRIDADAHALICKDENQAEQILQYTQLILANGAEKISIPLTGNAVDDVLSVNHLDDYRLFRSRLSDNKRIAIIGAGLIGCEFTNDLINTGHHVEVIAIDDYPLTKLVPEPVGKALQAALEKAGVVWHLSSTVKTVSQVDDDYEVSLSNGETVTADLVFCAVGIKPDLSLAKTANLKTNCGILVNRQLQTSDFNIFALGDCAEVDGEVKMYIAPILQAARVLAQVLVGNDKALYYPVMPIIVKTPTCPVVVVQPPENTKGEWKIECDGTNVRALFYDQSNQLCGFALCGDSVKDKMNLVKQLSSI